MKYNTVVMIGKPGSGKGMQSNLLSDDTGFQVFSTGDRFREIQKEDSLRGRKTSEIMNSGQLMPHWFAAYLFQEAILGLREEEGIVFEGTARKKPEAILFNEIMEWLNRPYIAVNLKVSDEVVVERLLKRREIEGRADDTEDKIKVRLKVYQDEIAESMDFFKSQKTLVELDGNREPEEIHKDIMKLITN